ncbi:hypothetical protein GPECTOR_6g665 [Gonium pectorale]|uniref:Wbp11/ELF5/Saf1 N-terminal domain-containing protein n=1 Tax=Gonium pectorale TaxID=33097 RepID=A0A150GVN4_GONPE|nr:hypothetical protein GPECTOR_6g665 [Gonium pectorale]|eukprot:KXZ53748.1 hypothetical protein GPECTOR_6g665 [Gonium pectorale]
MVKTKGGRLLNPADAFRKEQRKKEVARNKMERKFIREGAKLRSEPDILKKELQELIDLEENGTLPKNLKLKKKALQEAYDQALKRKKEEELKARTGGPQLAAPGAAGPVMLRPQDSPYYHPTLNPSGAPPPGKGVVPTVPSKAPAGPAIPVPKAPPLPSGPKPNLPPPPGAPPLPKGPTPAAPLAQYAAPPAVAPAAAARLSKDAAAATITGASTVAKRLPATQDKQLLSLVPASLRVRRDDAPKPKRQATGAGRADASSGFGLAPKPASAGEGGKGADGGSASTDQKYLDFLASVADLGAFD